MTELLQAHSYQLQRMLERHDIDLLIRPDKATITIVLCFAIQADKLHDRCQIGQYKTLDYHKLPQIEQLGFEHGDEQLRHFLHELSSAQLSRMQTSTVPLPGSSVSLNQHNCEPETAYLQGVDSAPLIGHSVRATSGGQNAKSRSH